MGGGQCELSSLDTVQVVFSFAIFDDNVHDSVIFLFYICLYTQHDNDRLPVIPDRLDK